MTDVAREWLSILQTLIDCGVPVDVAHKALGMIREGKPLRDAFDLCIQALDAADEVSPELVHAAQLLVNQAVSAATAVPKPA